MGRTPVPLAIIIHPSIDGPEFDALRAKGHTVSRMDDDEWYDIESYDLVLGPNCQRMTPDLINLLDVTLTRIRREKREDRR